MAPLDNVDYKKAMKVVGATLAARLSARGMIKRSDGSTKKGKLGKPEEEMLTCGCDQITEEKREFVKGWVNPRTKKIIAWRHHTPFHATHIYENLSKYGLTKDDLIDHHIDVVSKRNPKYTLTREKSLERFEKIGYNDMLADRDETIEYPAIKKGWVAFVLQETKYGKMMTLRGITKDIKKSGVMVLEKFKTFKDLDRILITNYKNTKFAEYTGKTKNEDERHTSNSEAMKFLFGRRPKRREPKTEIGRTMAMFREDQELDEVNIPGYKGWVNPKTGKTQIIQGHSPYHVMMIANNPRFYGLTEKLILNHLIETYKERDSPIPEEDAEFAMQRLKSGERDMDYGVELLAMEKGWVRFVEGEYAEISGRKRFNDRELRKILQLIDEETPLTMKSKTTMGLQQYRPVSKTDVKVELYGNLEMNEIKNLIKGRRRGDKQTEIGRTMAMFREYVEVTEGEWKDKNDEREHNKLFMKSLKVMPKSPKQKKIIQQMNALRKKNGLELLGEEKRVPKTRKNQDPDTHSDLYTDENPEGTIHGLGFKDVETAEASVRKIKASDRTHAHKIQAAIAMEQRAKVMKKTAEAAVYRKFIEQMKKKTKEMNEEAYLPGQATTSHGGKSGRGGKPGPRMSRQRKNRAAVLDHLILNGIQVLNQPADVRQKGSSDTFVVAKKDLKRATEIVDDYFSKKYVRMHMAKNQLRRENYKIIAESVELNESFFDFMMGAMMADAVARGGMTTQQTIGAVLTLAAIPVGLYGMMGVRHIQRKLNIGGKRLSSARKKLDDIIQDDVRVAVFVDWLQEQPYFDKAIDKLEDANADLKQAYDEKDGAAEEIAQKDIQRILSEFGRALKPDWDKFAAKEGFTKLTDKADIGSGISRNLLNRVNKAGKKYNITNYRVYENVNEVYKDSGLGDWFGKGGGGGKEEGGWDRYNTAGERIGKCGDAKKGAAYSACLSAEKAKQLGKDGIAKFVKRKRAAQKKAGDKAKGGESKKGQKPVMVKTGAKGLDKKNESYMSFKSFISEGENKPNNPELWKKAIAKAKEKFDVYPSAYANAWASKWYKSKGGTWSKK